jgi:hypothetical protein
MENEPRLGVGGAFHIPRCHDSGLRSYPELTNSVDILTTCPPPIKSVQGRVHESTETWVGGGSDVTVSSAREALTYACLIMKSNHQEITGMERWQLLLTHNPRKGSNELSVELKTRMIVCDLSKG